MGAGRSVKGIICHPWFESLGKGAGYAPPPLATPLRHLFLNDDIHS